MCPSLSSVYVKRVVIGGADLRGVKSHDIVGAFGTPNAVPTAQRHLLAHSLKRLIAKSREVPEGKPGVQLCDVKQEITANLLQLNQRIDL